MDPGIVCYRHCDSNVFCLALPHTCHLCNASLSNAQLPFLPFRVPYPFVRAGQHPCSVVIKPTSGDFLNDYFNSMDLHIGVTSSSGTIIEYDKNGLRSDQNHQWGQCLLLDQASTPWKEHWDETLFQFCKQKCWSAKYYNEETNNCYSFVLSFLRTLNYGNVSKAAINKTVFCEKFIVPQTTSAGKYISLYRKLRDSGFYIHS